MFSLYKNSLRILAEAEKIDSILVYVIFNLFAYYLCAKGKQGQLSQFKMLDTKGNANNSAAQNNAKHHMCYCQLEAAKDEPQDVEQELACATTILNFLTKGEKA